MTKRRKPHDPHATTLATLERQERETELARLKAMGAEVNLDPRTGKILSAWKTNFIRLLLDAKAITQNHANAYEWMAGHWATWKQKDGTPKAEGFVDGGSGHPDLVTDRMLKARCIVETTFAKLGPSDPRLLQAFLVATVEEDRPMMWRGIVERETGVTSQPKQVERVRVMLENLRMVREG